VALPVFGTLALSRDGAHFAVLGMDRGKQRLDLVVDGVRRKSFDFEEPAALALKNPRALVEDSLPRWVAAELALHLGEQR
jgi:hypothetical protein